MSRGEPSNFERAFRARRVVERYGDWSKVERETTLTDLLADLMHLAKRSKLDWDDILRRAENHFYEENRDDPGSSKDWSPLL